MSPTIVILIDRNTDISFVYTSAEEEQSVKNNIIAEYTLNDESAHQASIQFLKEKQLIYTYENKNFNSLSKEVLSPPPDFI
ncbi:hypothetical protein L1I30_03435 [Gillisia sp. M10.2A]|uniref:Uncharacterized protein n=1 Tax=Gillisia lutea TaxID=2909668 RepID=A0ABS9ECY2_9FLAO|nr:hypothetical protein [Gillisia lutea]MCF4100712.1 hypothetical protein [Gillisia lutea]